MYPLISIDLAKDSIEDLLIIITVKPVLSDQNKGLNGKW